MSVEQIEQHMTRRSYGDYDPTAPVEVLQQRMMDNLSIVRQVAHETSLTRLDGLANVDVYAKNEHMQRFGSFKVRGAMLALHRAYERGSREFVTRSAGNYAQGFAQAINLLQTKDPTVSGSVFMPMSTPECKVMGTYEAGNGSTQVELVEGTFESCLEQVALAEMIGAEHISPYDNIDVVEGQATASYEALVQQPDTKRLFVPEGGGGAVSGALLAASLLKRAYPETYAGLKVVGVMLEGNDSAWRTMQNGGIPTSATALDDICEGASVEMPGAIPAGIHYDLREHLEFVTVSRAQVGEGFAREIDRLQYEAPAMGAAAYTNLPETTAMLAEVGAHAYHAEYGAPSIREAWTVLVTGGNYDTNKINTLLAEYEMHNEKTRRSLGNMSTNVWRASQLVRGPLGPLYRS